jgi:hypothetical protein
MRLQHFIFLFFSPVFLLGEFELPRSVTQGLVEGQIKLFYSDIDKETEEDAYATALGGYLKYSTDVNRTFYAAVRFHTSQPVGPSLNREQTALFNSDRNGEQLTVNSEAYIGWRGSTRVLKVGNMMLNTPMMNDDTTRIVPWSYQGAAYTGEAVPNTKVQLYHIRQIRSHTSDKYTKESASGEIGSGITMLSIEYDGLEHFDLQSYYYYAPDLYSTFIAQADYKLVIDKDNMICASIQYFKSGNGGKYAQRENKNGGDDIDLLALRIGYDSEDFNINLNYSQNFGISGIVKGYGGLAKVFTTSMVANGRGNYKPETWMLKSTYDLPRTSWGESELALNLTHTRTNDSRGDDFDAVYLHFKQRFNIDTSLYVRYENMDYKNDKSDVKYFRIIASYDF